MDKKMDSGCSVCGDLLKECQCAGPKLSTTLDTTIPAQQAADEHEFAVTTQTTVTKNEQIIDSKFRVLGELGSGGDSTVYLAEHLFLRKQVSLKVFRAIDSDLNRFARVQREAILLARLRHPNLVEVIDLGLIESSKPYIVQEYIEGKDLLEYLRSRGHLDQQTAVKLFCEIAEAIKYLHDNNIIHRDIKPSNVIVTNTRDGGTTAKLIDLGIAKPENPGGAVSFATASGKVFGSPLYMSPEQCSGDKVDFKADIYSFGCLMFETLTGSPPFRGETMLVTLDKHVNELPPLVNTRRQGADPITAELEAIVAKCLMKSPQARPNSMADVLQVLKKHMPQRRQRPMFPVIVLTLILFSGIAFSIGMPHTSMQGGLSNESAMIDLMSRTELVAAKEIDEVLKAHRVAFEEGKRQKVDASAQLQLGALQLQANSKFRRSQENIRVFADLQPYLKEIESKLLQNPGAFDARSLDALWRIYLFKGDAAKSNEASEKAYRKALSYALLTDQRMHQATQGAAIIKSRLAVVSLLNGDMATATRLATASSLELKKGQIYNTDNRFDNTFVLAKTALLNGNFDYACTALIYCTKLKRSITSRLPDNALQQLADDLKQKMGKANFETVMKNKTMSSIHDNG